MSDTNNGEVQWTSKLPALIAGLVLIIAGLIAGGKRKLMASIILVALGLGFVGYSLTVKDWCAMKGSTLGQTPWGSGWGGGFDQCLKQKGWFAF